MYTNPWSNSISSDSTYLKDLDAVINRTLVDVEQRMDTIIGSDNWSSGDDPVIDGINILSLAALKTRLDSIVTGPTINSLNEFIPKRNNATSFGNSLLQDNGVSVRLTGNRPFCHVYRTSFTLANGIQTFSTEVANDMSMFIAGTPNRMVVPSNCAGMWMMFSVINSVSTQFNGQQYQFYKNGGQIGSTFVAQDAKSLFMFHMETLNAADYIQINVPTGSAISISDHQFYMVRMW